MKEASAMNAIGRLEDNRTSLILVSQCSAGDALTDNESLRFK